MGHNLLKNTDRVLRISGVQQLPRNFHRFLAVTEVTDVVSGGTVYQSIIFMSAKIAFPNPGFGSIDKRLPADYTVSHRGH